MKEYWAGCRKVRDVERVVANFRLLPRSRFQATHANTVEKLYANSGRKNKPCETPGFMPVYGGLHGLAERRWPSAWVSLFSTVITQVHGRIYALFCGDCVTR